MMSSAVALKAPIATEPMLDALRALRAQPTPDAVERPAPAPSVTTPAIASPAETTRPIVWVEPADNLWLLSLKNFGLTLATFGVYHFWGRAETRRQVVNAVQVNGKSVDYTGTGKEAFVAFLIGAVVAVSIVGAFIYLFAVANGGAGAQGVAGIQEFRWKRLFISLPLLFLLGSTVYRKRQHLLRRTWIDGQRFDLNGHAWSYAWQHFWSAFLVPLTAGWAAPWRASRLEARKINEMFHGSQLFHAKPDLKPVYKNFAVLWFGGGSIYVGMLVVLSMFIGPQLMEAINTLSIKPLLSVPVAQQAAVVIGVALIPLSLLVVTYRKTWLEHQVSSVMFEGGRLRLKMPLGRYLGLWLSNMLLKVLSFGAFAPVADARSTRFIVNHMVVEGDLKLGRTVAE